MPVEVAMGFDYLCSRYGRQRLESDRRQHEALVDEIMNNINNMHKRSQQYQATGF